MENYKEKYEMALETVQEILDSGDDSIKMSRLKLRLQSVFSELKESDEEIKEALIALVKCNERSGYTLLNNVSTSSMIAWIEKQSKKTSIWKHWKNGICGNGEGKLVFLIKNGATYSLSSCLSFECDYIELSELENLMLEKQGEQKSVDKIEPKFKVGDFIANDYCRGKVVELTNDAYLLDTEQGMPFSYEHNIHLWTIEDAKEGDVLSYVTDEKDLWIMIYWSLYKPYKGHVHYHALLINNNFSDKGTCCIDINNLKPATKEQRDLLFAKMHEAGYEWDVDKKELIKL